VPCLGNRELKIDITHQMFSSGTLGNGEKLGKPALSMLPSTGKKNIARFKLFKIPSGATLKGFVSQIRPVGCMLDTPDLD